MKVITDFHTTNSFLFIPVLIVVPELISCLAYFDSCLKIHLIVIFKLKIPSPDLTDSYTLSYMEI